eukprot:ANDGO_01022.mRNA.1 hypothetical protein
MNASTAQQSMTGHIRVRSACSACKKAKTACSDDRPCFRCSRLGLDCDKQHSAEGGQSDPQFTFRAKVRRQTMDISKKRDWSAMSSDYVSAGAGGFPTQHYTGSSIHSVSALQPSFPFSNGQFQNHLGHLQWAPSALHHPMGVLANQMISNFQTPPAGSIQITSPSESIGGPSFGKTASGSNILPIHPDFDGPRRTSVSSDVAIPSSVSSLPSASSNTHVSAAQGSPKTNAQASRNVLSPDGNAMNNNPSNGIIQHNDTASDTNNQCKLAQPIGGPIELKISCPDPLLIIRTTHLPSYTSVIRARWNALPADLRGQVSYQGRLYQLMMHVVADFAKSGKKEYFQPMLDEIELMATELCSRDAIAHAKMFVGTDVPRMEDHCPANSVASDLFGVVSCWYHGLGSMTVRVNVEALSVLQCSSMGEAEALLGLGGDKFAFIHIEDTMWFFHDIFDAMVLQKAKIGRMFRGSRKAGEWILYQCRRITKFNPAGYSAFEEWYFQVLDPKVEVGSSISTGN